MAIIGVPTQRLFYNKFAFTVEIDGLAYAGFQDCSEISMEVAKIEHWEGGKIIPHKSPGRLTVADVTLTRGATDDLDLYTWMSQVVVAEAMLAEPDYIRGVDVVQRDRRGVELQRWSLIAAWPTKFVAGSWDNKSDEKTIESVTLCYSYPTIGGDTSP